MQVLHDVEATVVQVLHDVEATVGSDVFGNSMVREYMGHEQDGKVFGSAMDCRRNEDRLLGETEEVALRRRLMAAPAMAAAES